MHPAQALEGFQVDGVITHGQILAFNQGEPQITGQEYMLEIGFVEPPGGQKHAKRRFGSGWRHTRQAVLKALEKLRKVGHRQVVERRRERPGNHQPVLKRVTSPGRRLGSVRHHPPAAVRRARQIHGVQVQETATRRLDTLAGPLEARLSIDQGRRHKPLF